MSPTFACIYCNKVKPISERSLEHIWPQVYGGNSCPSWFLSEQACKPCNSVLGRYVDVEFARTQFGTGMRLEAAMPFIDTAKPAPLPLIYMGVQATKPSDRDVCETWIGPRGEAVYYFHENDGEITQPDVWTLGCGFNPHRWLSS